MEETEVFVTLTTRERYRPIHVLYENILYIIQPSEEYKWCYVYLKGGGKPLCVDGDATYVTGSISRQIQARREG